MKKIILLSLILLTISCRHSKKSGPAVENASFKLAMGSLNLSSTASTVAKLAREKPDSAPEIQIQTDKPGGVTKISKILKCGPVVLPGKSISAPDLNMFHFKLTNVEFPGLSELPQTTTCTLGISVEYTGDQVWKKDFPIKLSFDGPAAMTMLRIVLGQKSFQFTNGQLEIERFSVTNNYTYPLGITYFFHKTLVTAFYYTGIGAPNILPLAVDKYVIQGSYDLVDTAPDSVSIKIPQGQTVIINGYMTEPAALAVNDFSRQINVNQDMFHTAPQVLAPFHDFEFNQNDKIGDNVYSLGWAWWHRF